MMRHKGNGRESQGHVCEQIDQRRFEMKVGSEGFAVDLFVCVKTGYEGL